MEKNTEIYGIRAVIEAINSSKDIDKVFIQTGLKGKLIGQLESLIRKNKINFSMSQHKNLIDFQKRIIKGLLLGLLQLSFILLIALAK